MRIDDEGLLALPIPAHPRPVRELARGASRVDPGGLEPRCEMCGHSVVATQCKRICLKCGFMAGSAEGI